MRHCLSVAATVLVAFLTALPATGFAQHKALDFKPLENRPTRPAKAPVRPKACPEYGAGFYRIDGSDTCIRMGGSVEAIVSSGRGIAATPGR